MVRPTCGAVAAEPFAGGSVSGEPSLNCSVADMAVSAAHRPGQPAGPPQRAADHQRPGLVEHAVRAGIITSMSAIVGELTVHDESRTNIVSRIDRHGCPVAYAKQAGWAALADHDDPVATERTVLRLLGSSGLVPALLGDDRDVLWTAPITGAVPLHNLIGATRRAAFLTLVRTWGVAMASLHQLPTRFGDVPSAPRPWILDPYRLPAHLALSRTPRMARALRSIYRSPGVLAALAEVGDRWQGSHWTHGDLTSTNVLATRAGRHDWRVWFVDLEAAGLGDPSWDLATAYDSLLLYRARLGSTLAPALRALLDGYRTAGGAGRLTRTLLTARAALTSIQIAAADERDARGDRRPLQPTRPAQSSRRARPTTPTAGRPRSYAPDPATTVARSA